MEYHNQLVAKNPEYRKNRLKIEKSARYFLRRNNRRVQRDTPIYIPLVIHVLYNNDEQNISEEQIQSQIDVLNRDYSLTNTDVDKVPEVFRSRIGNAGLRFKLATKDPNGNPTNGIVRVSTNIEGFTHNDEEIMKFSSKGGSDAWPADEYRNRGGGRLTGGLLGYAAFPGGKPEKDGVVIGYSYFGTIGTATTPFNGGRTATHEIGHWLNLLHIWGDDINACTGSDNIMDTPNHGGPNYGKPVFPSISCNNGPNGDMFMNFMDYVDDDSMVMFTNGQVDRVEATLNGPRAGMLTSEGLETPEPSILIDDKTKNIIEEFEMSSKYESKAMRYFNGISWDKPNT